MDVADHNHLLSTLAPPPPACANCGAALSGRYCAQCGQRADTAAHSVGHFLWEAIEALTHADSRVWGTLQPLLRSPGFLTREFFAGRRARYVQPLRLYLILSVVFFVISALLSGGTAEHSPRQGPKVSDQRGLRQPEDGYYLGPRAARVRGSRPPAGTWLPMAGVGWARPW